MSVVMTKDGLMFESEDFMRACAAILRDASNVFTVKLAANYRQTSPQSIIRLINSGSLPATRVGHMIAIRQADLDALPPVNSKEIRSQGQKRRHAKARASKSTKS